LYLKALFKRGGVIDAWPSNIANLPSVELLIEPDGTLKVLGTFDRVLNPS